MKYMKLGSKPDQFQTDGDNIRYVATDLATDIVIAVGNVKFYLHKFPLLSKSARLQKLVAMTNEENNDEINIHDIPGGPMTFEICAKFCYGMTVTLNAYDVIAARCAAEYLEMYETVEKGNLVYKIEVFLNSSIFRSWKDSIIALQTTKSFQPWSEELKIVNQCLESIASKVSVDTTKVDWSYTYNREKLPSDPHWNGTVPKDWWVEDLCDLQIDIYKRVICTIRTKGGVSPNVIGKSLKAYIYKRLPGFSKGNINIQGGDYIKYQYIVDTINCLLPIGKYSVACSFLFKLLQASISLECGENGSRELMKKIGQQLEEATVSDLQIQGPPGVTAIYNIEIVHELVEQFILQEHDNNSIDAADNNDFIETCRSKVVISDTSKMKVAQLVDLYLAEASRDPSLPVAKFIELAEMVSGFPRPSHDGIYRAIDMYLKEHPEITKSERKRMCKLMDVRKLSVEACTHAVQNERLPLRVVVQVLFFEQVRSAASSGGHSPSDLSGSIGATTIVPGGSHGSSRSVTTNTEDEWDTIPMGEDLKALKGELATLRLKDQQDHGNGGSRSSYNRGAESEKIAASKMKGLAMSSKIFTKLWSSNKERRGEKSSSETSESPLSSNAEETKSSTHSRS